MIRLFLAMCSCARSWQSVSQGSGSLFDAKSFHPQQHKFDFVTFMNRIIPVSLAEDFPSRNAFWVTYFPCYRNLRLKCVRNDASYLFPEDEIRHFKGSQIKAKKRWLEINRFHQSFASWKDYFTPFSFHYNLGCYCTRPQNIIFFNWIKHSIQQ